MWVSLSSCRRMWAAWDLFNITVYVDLYSYVRYGLSARLDFVLTALPYSIRSLKSCSLLPFCGIRIGDLFVILADGKVGQCCIGVNWGRVKGGNKTGGSSCGRTQRWGNVEGNLQHVGSPHLMPKTLGSFLLNRTCCQSHVTPPPPSVALPTTPSRRHSGARSRTHRAHKRSPLCSF